MAGLLGVPAEKALTPMSCDSAGGWLLTCMWACNTESLRLALRLLLLQSVACLLSPQTVTHTPDQAVGLCSGDTEAKEA